MSIVTRQSEIFAAEDWTVLYQAFASINFNATDPTSIAAALRSYLQQNFPEAFNDWIASSEFVAIIDLLAWLAGTLAFKTDLAARENFLDTAEARQSILRLARFLSYNPSRCQSATGILKIIAVSTDDDVVDSFGINQANNTITWNDPSNPNWFEQFTLVLNNAFVTTNPFGVPFKDGTVSGLETQLYRINGLASKSNLNFSANVSGISMDFEICNADFTDQGVLFERSPNPNVNAFQFYYLSDGNGNSSNRTGFFLLFKQGTTQQQLFNITVPVENQLLDVISNNINQDDVWVQTIDDNNNVMIDWTKVPAILNANITYNDIPLDQRNIFSVVTRDNDQVTIRFSDGRFGNAPIGIIGVTYRVANGLQYQIKPLEIDSVQVALKYVNTNGVEKNLYLTLSLFETVSNAAAAETTEQIRQRAPQVYATQNRMVSGEDYNTFPLSSNLAVKIKAVNRIYSGQSRYIDLRDPTGNYQDLSLFAEDGIFFRDPSGTYFEVPASLNRTSQEVIDNYILPALDQYTTTNLISDVLMQNVLSGTITPTVTTWTASSAGLFETTGYFDLNDPLIQPGAIVQFALADGAKWIAVVDVQGTINAAPPANTAGPVTLAQAVPSGSTVLAVLPGAFDKPSSGVIGAMRDNLDKRFSFSLWYNYARVGTNDAWFLQDVQNDFGGPQPALVGAGLQIANVTYIGGLWRISTQGLRYVFESIADIEWFDNGSRALAQLTGEATRDTIRVMRINRDLNSLAGYAFTRDYNLSIDRLWLYPDGTPEPRRATVVLYDSDVDGYPDDPDIYYHLAASTVKDSYVFWSNADNPPFETPLYSVVVYETEALRSGDSPPLNTIGFQLRGATYLTDETFWVFTSGGWQQDVAQTYRAARGRGPNVASKWISVGSGVLVPAGDKTIFQWKHFAPTDHRIDPSITNIIDIFVLTSAYDASVRQWINAGAVVANKPTAPSELELRLQFTDQEKFKMFSDTIVWRPVRYKYLFGNGADPELRAQFKVVRIGNSSVSDGEIKSRMIAAIDAYFAVANWDFGETFYFTELAAYIHQQLAGLIGSVVIVPLAANSSFGDGFEVSCRSDEIFISTAQVSDIQLIQSNTPINLRIR